MSGCRLAANLRKNFSLKVGNCFRSVSRLVSRGLRGPAAPAVAAFTTFNEAVAASTPMPTVAPEISGTWSVSGDTITFQPTLGWKPGTHVALSIPGGKGGVQAAGLDSPGTTTTAATDIGPLPESTSVKYTTGAYSTLRLQQLLTQLGYLPLTFTADDPSAPAIPAASINAQLSADYIVKWVSYFNGG
jgi:hypothetical protein